MLEAAVSGSEDTKSVRMLRTSLAYLTDWAYSLLP